MGSSCSTRIRRGPATLSTSERGGIREDRIVTAHSLDPALFPSFPPSNDPIAPPPSSTSLNDEDGTRVVQVDRNDSNLVSEGVSIKEASPFPLEPALLRPLPSSNEPRIPNNKDNAQAVQADRVNSSPVSDPLSMEETSQSALTLQNQVQHRVDRSRMRVSTAELGSPLPRWTPPPPRYIQRPSHTDSWISTPFAYGDAVSSVRRLLTEPADVVAAGASLGDEAEVVMDMLQEVGRTHPCCSAMA